MKTILSLAFVAILGLASASFYASTATAEFIPVEKLTMVQEAGNVASAQEDYGHHHHGHHYYGHHHHGHHYYGHHHH